jgi:hypothetical protein
MIDVKLAKFAGQESTAGGMGERKGNYQLKDVLWMCYRYDALSDLSQSDQREKCSQGGKKWLTPSVSFFCIH